MRALVVATVALLAAVAVPASSAEHAARVREGALYKIELLNGTGHVDANGESNGLILASSENSTALTANWTFKPKPAQIWLEKNDAILKSVQTTAQAGDNETNTGTIQSNDTFTWFDHNDPKVTPHKGVSDCHGSVENQIVVKYTADSTPASTSLEVDLTGGFHVATSGQNNELSCSNSPDLRNADGQPSAPASWGFGWDPESGPTATNQKMQLIASIPRAAIGLASISPILSNSSNVSSSENCTDLNIDPCNVTFKLDGELELTKICNGTIGAGGIGTCTGGGGQGGSKNPPPGPPPTHAPKLTKLKVTPAKFVHGAGNVRITYDDDQPGCHTQLKIVGTIKVAGHTVGPFPFGIFAHVDTAKNSVALPASLLRVLQPGHYTVEATAINLKTHKQSTPVKATFDAT